MKRLLLLALIIAPLAGAMQQLSPIKAIEYPALVFLKVDNQTSKDYTLQKRDSQIIPLPKKSEIILEKAIPFTWYGSYDAPSKIYNGDISIKQSHSKYADLGLTIIRQERHNLMNFVLQEYSPEFKLIKPFHQKFAIEPSQNDDIYSVKLTLAGDNLENSIMNVEHVRSNHFAQMLRECGAHLNGVDPAKWTPLMKVAMLDVNLMRFLINAGANIHAQCPVTKSTALHIAAGLGSLESVEALLEHSAAKDLQVKDQYGNTPLHCAVLVDYTQPDGKDKVHRLIQAGSNLLIRNHRGLMPLGLAMLWAEKRPAEMKPVLETLKQAHIDRHHTYVKEQSALMGLS